MLTKRSRSQYILPRLSMPRRKRIPHLDTDLEELANHMRGFSDDNLVKMITIDAHQYRQGTLARKPLMLA
jgi:hypothetical protein